LVLKKLRTPLEWTRLADFAPDGDLVPLALQAVRKGGRVGLRRHTGERYAAFPLRLWEERQLLSVANLTRQDGLDFRALVPQIGIVTKTNVLPLRQANQALDDLRGGQFEDAVVLVP